MTGMHSVTTRIAAHMRKLRGLRDARAKQEALLKQARITELEYRTNLTLLDDVRRAALDELRPARKIVGLQRKLRDTAAAKAELLALLEKGAISEPEGRISLKLLDDVEQHDGGLLMRLMSGREAE